MPPVPGTFDGTRIKDLRLLLAKTIQEHYKEHGTWEDIVACRFYEHSEVVTVWIPHGFRKDKWRATDSSRSKRYWEIADDEFIWQHDLDAARERKTKLDAWAKRK